MESSINGCLYLQVVDVQLAEVGLAFVPIGEFLKRLVHGLVQCVILFVELIHQLDRSFQALE